MTDDERAIRTVVETWMAASRSGDLAAVLDLMTDDVVFMVPGQQPFGKDAFAAASRQAVSIDGNADIVELQVLHDWAFIRNRLQMTMTPPNGTPMRCSGYTLTLLRRCPDGRWRVMRDANLMMADIS